MSKESGSLDGSCANNGAAMIANRSATPRINENEQEAYRLVVPTAEAASEPTAEPTSEPAAESTKSTAESAESGADSASTTDADATANSADAANTTDSASAARAADRADSATTGNATDRANATDAAHSAAKHRLVLDRHSRRSRNLRRHLLSSVRQRSGCRADSGRSRADFWARIGKFMSRRGDCPACGLCNRLWKS